MDASNVGDFLRQSTVTSTVHSFMRGRQDDPRTLLFFQVSVEESEHGGEDNGTDETGLESSKESDNNNTTGSSSNTNTNTNNQEEKNSVQKIQTMKTKKGPKTKRRKLVFTTGATDGLQGICVYFLALPVVGKPDPALGFLGSFRIVSGQFDAKSGPSLLSDMSDLIGMVYGPIHALEQSGISTTNTMTTPQYPSALTANSMGSADPIINNIQNTFAPNIDTTIQEFSALMRTTSSSMAHVGHVSQLTTAIEEADLSTTSPDRLLRQLNRLLSNMLAASTEENEKNEVPNYSSTRKGGGNGNGNGNGESGGKKNNGNNNKNKQSEDGGYDDNAELLKWKVTMVRLASALQQAEEPVFLELLKQVKNQSMVREWELQLGDLRHRLAEAKDNVKYLYAIAEITRPLLSEHPKSLIETMPRIVNSIAWMACISRFFNTPDRLGSLFRRLSDRVVRSCKRCVYGAWKEFIQPEQDLSLSSLSSAPPLAVQSHWDLRVRLNVVESIESCIELCEAFRTSYTETRIGLKKFPSAPQFDFNELHIFGPINDFQQRAHVLREMLQTLHELSSLGKRGSPLRDETKQVLRRIALLERKYASEAFDPLNNTRVLGGSNLTNLINAFRSFVIELVSNVKTAIETRLRECTSTRQALKFLAGVLSISGLMAQPGMPDAVQGYYSSVVKRYRTELDRIAKLYEHQKHDPPLRRSIPPVAGHIEWSRQLFRRISEPMQLIQQHDKKSWQQENKVEVGEKDNERDNERDIERGNDVSDVGSGVAASLNGEDSLELDDVPKKQRLTVLSSELVRVYNRIATTLVKYETLWHKEWEKSVDGFQEHLHRPLLIRTASVELHEFKSLVDLKGKGDEEEEKKGKSKGKGNEDEDEDVPKLGIHGIHVNFDARLFQLTHEARHMVRLGYSVPESARFVCEQESRLKRTFDELKFLLHELHDSMVQIPESVRPLLVPLLKRIEAVIRPGLHAAVDENTAVKVTTLTWMSLRVPAYVARVEQAVRDLQGRVAKTRDVLEHQVTPSISLIRDHGGDVFLNLPRGMHAAQLSVAGFLEHVETRCTHVAKKIEERSASIEGAVEHMIGRACENYNAKELIQVTECANTLRKHYEDMIQNAVENVIISTLRALRLRVASGVGGCFLFLDPPLFRVEAQLKIPEVILSPPLDTIQLCINKAAKAIIFSTRQVYRWSARRNQTLALALGGAANAPGHHEDENIDAAAAAASERAVVAPPLSEKHSFFINIAQKRGLVKVVLQMTASLSRLHLRVGEHLQAFEQFGFLWKKMANEQLAGFINEPTDERFSLIQDITVEPSPEDAYVRHHASQQEPTMVDEFAKEIKLLNTVLERIDLVKPIKIIESLAVDCTSLKASLQAEAKRWKQLYGNALAEWALDEIRSLQGFLSETRTALEHEVTNLDELSAMMNTLLALRELESEIDEKIQPILEAQSLLDRFRIDVSTQHVDMVLALQDEWQKLKQLAEDCADRLQQLQPIFRRQLNDDVSAFKVDVSEFCTNWDDRGPSSLDAEEPKTVRIRLDEFTLSFSTRQRKFERFAAGEVLFGQAVTTFPDLESIEVQIEQLTLLLSLHQDATSTIHRYEHQKWHATNFRELQETMQSLRQRWSAVPEAAHVHTNMCVPIKLLLEAFSQKLTIILRLAKPSMMMRRHWELLEEILSIDLFNQGGENVGYQAPVASTRMENWKLGKVTKAPILEHRDTILALCASASKEGGVRRKLDKIKADWTFAELTFTSYKSTSHKGQVVLESRATHALMVRLEDSVVALSALAASRYTSPFRPELLQWLQTLGTVRETLEHWLEVQALWMYLEAVFSGGDIALSMPLEAKRFAALDKTWVTAVLSAVAQPDVINVCCTNDNIRNALPYLSEQFERSQKSLSGYLAQKRDQFPRFYFLSDPVLLEILGRGSEPTSIQPHVHRLFASIGKIIFVKNDEGTPIDKISGVVSQTGDILPFVGDRMVRTSTHIERWLSWLEAEIRFMVCSNVYDAVVEVAGGDDDSDEDDVELEDFSALGIGNNGNNGNGNGRGSSGSGGAQRIDSRRGPLSNKTDILHLLESSSTQSCLTAIHVSWTNQCTECINLLKVVNPYAAKVDKDKKDTNIKKDKRSSIRESLALVLQRMSMSLKVMVSQAADPNFPSLYRKKLEAVITLQIHLRDSTDALYRLRIKSVHEFDWQRQIKMYWMPDNYGTLEEIADGIAELQHAHRSGGGHRGRIHVDSKHVEGGSKKIQEGSLENKTTSCCVTRILMCEEPYGFEYLGPCTRLVMTPLTERCYITLAQALSLFLGAAPTGPAGTGKTETVKDMAKAMGRLVYVFNCSNQMNVRALGQIFKGLAQCGAWGDFDEFNRIDLGVLSVAAQQISIIFEALRAKKITTTFLDGKRCAVHRNCGMFITMNPPQYGGRTALPENLKAQFRSVSMIKPNRQSIIRVILSSSGFQLADELASRLHVLYGLCKQQLSNQPHYDFGLRSILSILETAGKSLRICLANEELQRDVTDPPIKTSPSLENRVFVDTIRDLNVPRLSAEDAPLFSGLLDDLWSQSDTNDEQQISTQDTEIMEHLIESARDQMCDPSPIFMDKVMQLYKVSDVRVGIALIGGSMSGKTCATRVLLQTLSEMSDDKVYRESRMNPRSVGRDRVFGRLDPVTFDWTDGVLTRLWRRAVQRQKTQDEHTWLIIDGPVDPEWIEDLNSVLDDNRVLTLANSDRLAIPMGTKLIFEVEDLRHASPATVSRLGIVNMGNEPSGIGVEATVSWKSLVSSWARECKMQRAEIQATDILEANISNVRSVVEEKNINNSNNSIKNSQTSNDNKSSSKMLTNLDKILELVEQHMESSLLFVVSHCAPLLPVRWGPLVRNFLLLLNSVAESCEIDFLAIWTPAREVDRCFVYSLAWSLASLLNDKDRSMFDEFIRGEYEESETEAALLQILPGSVYDTIYQYDLRADRSSSCSWVHYEEIVLMERPRFDLSSNLMIVPTIQHIRCRDQYVRFSKNGSVVLVGDSASGKSTILADGIDTRRTHAEMEELGGGQGPGQTVVAALSSFRVSLTGPHGAEDLQAIIERELEKKMAQTYGPRRAKRLIYVLQDMNVPEPDKWGTRPVLELVSQMTHEQGLYSTTKAGEWHSFDGVELTGTMIMNSQRTVDNIRSRILGRLILLGVETPSQALLQTIFEQIINGKLEEQNKMKMNEFSKEIIGMTLSLLAWSSKRFVSTPLHPWVTFTVRDVSSIFQGLNMSQKGGVSTSQSEMMTMWRHECERTMMDKLTDPIDREEFSIEVVKRVQDLDANWVPSASALNGRSNSPSKYSPSKSKTSSNYEQAIIGSSMYYYMPMLPSKNDNALSGVQKKSGDLCYSMVESVDEVRPKLESLLQRSKSIGTIPSEDDLSEQVMLATISTLDISLFADVIVHCMRISRALTHDAKHAIIVGISGTGKQSIAKLAAVASGFIVLKIPEQGRRVVKSTDIAAFQTIFMEQLRSLWKAAVLSNTPVVLLLTGEDCAIPNINGNSMILEYVNCLLSDGMVPGLFTTEELEALRLEMAASMTHASNTIQESFRRLRRNLRVIMCLNSRSAQLQKYFLAYPQLLRKSYVDVVDPWSRSALSLVAKQRLITTTFGNGDNNKTTKINSTTETRTKRRRSNKRKPADQTRGLVVDTLATLHMNASSNSDPMGLVTPRSFLGLLDTFKEVFEDSRTSRISQIKKLEKGQAKLAEAERGTEIMGHELKEQQVELEGKGEELARLLDRIRADTTMAERKKGEVEAVRRRLESEAKNLADKVLHIEAELADALPVLEEALAALDAITSGDISNLRTMRQPPMLIKRIMDAVLIIMKFPLPPQLVLYEMDAQGKSFVEGAEMLPCWNEAKTMMADGSKFLKSLTEFNPGLLNEESIDLLEPYLKRADFTYTAAKRSSGAIAGVCTWVRSLSNYFHVAKVVLPLKDAAELEQKRLEAKKSMLKGAEEELEEKKRELEKITTEYDDAMRSNQELEASLEHTRNNIEAARSLVASLEGEKIRWAQQHSEITIRLGHTPCEAAIAASFSIYAGALTPHQRLRMMTTWPKEVRWAELPDLVHAESLMDDYYTIKDITVESPVIIGLMLIIRRLLLPDNMEQRWILQGLPADEHSLQNAIIVKNSIGARVPLLLDPQGQGLRWLENSFKKSSNRNNIDGSVIESEVNSNSKSSGGMNKNTNTSTTSTSTSTKTIQTMVSITQDDPNLNEIVENALSNGKPIIVSDVRPNELPSILRALIVRTIVFSEDAQHDVLIINEEEYDFNPNFRLYLVREIESVDGFNNEMLGGITAVNFGITPHALEDQLLEIVASFELRDLQRQRRALLEELGRDRERLASLADILLASLSKAQGNLIEDGELIRVLKETQETVEQTSAKIESSLQTQITLHRARENYRMVAKRGSTIFFVIGELKKQNHVYQLSLSRFMEYYERAIRKAEPSEDTPKRVKRIIDAVTQVACLSVYAMLYGEDRMTFGLLLSLRILLDREHITHRHLRIMLSTPKVTAKRHVPVPKASSEWLTPQMWNQLCTYLGVVSEFDVVSDQLHAAHHTEGWRTWKDSVEPEKTKTPVVLGETGLFVLIRIWRPDRLVAMSKLIIDRELKSPATPSAIDMMKRDASMRRPTIYLLSRGADPARDIADLAHRERVEFHLFSMGQGQENQALSMLKKCTFEGTWLMLQNCHLNVDFMGELDRLLRASTKARGVGEVPTIDSTKGKGNKKENIRSRNGATTVSASVTKRKLESLTIQSSFRLFLTILPVSNFSESLLKLSVVVSSEPPNGLRSGLLACYANDGPAVEFFHDVGHEQWQNFLFALCFLHSTICQRREYGYFGWSFPYAFGKSDLQSSLMYSRTLFDSSDSNRSVDWISVRFVVCEILYGGLITTDSDRQVVQALGRSLLDNRIFTPGHHIAPGLPMPNIELTRESRARKNGKEKKHSLDSSNGSSSSASSSNNTPDNKKEGATLEDFVDYADNLPSNDHPEWYGLHQNAAFATLQASGRKLLRNTWHCFSEVINTHSIDSTRNSNSSNNSNTNTDNNNNDNDNAANYDSNQEEINAVQQLCNQIRSMAANFAKSKKVPKPIKSYMAPLNFVLRQEHAALKHVYKIMLADADGVLACIQDVSTSSPFSVALLNDIKLGLPASWARLIPSVGAYAGMSIGPWLQNIQRRHTQIQEWLKIEIHLIVTTRTNQRNAEHSLVKEKELTGLVHRLDMYDLGLFFNPPGFLVALRQEVVRLKRAQATKTPWSVEDTRLKTSILRSNLSGKLLLPKLGTNLYGLTMEGAAWDGHQLVEQNLQQDVTPMPVVALSVVHARAAQFDGRSFHCPVYRCSGSREKAFEISLPTDVSADHWILRGAALFLGRKLD